MIFYFSATGNSEYLARRISESTGDAAVDIADAMKGSMRYDLRDGETVMLVSPVYFYGLPLNVRTFIDTVVFSRVPVFDVLLNYGSFPGRAMISFCRCIKARGFSVRNRFEIRMPENYVLLFNPPDREKASEIIDSADAVLSRVIESVRSCEHADILHRRSVLQDIFGCIGRPMYVFGRSTRRFRCTDSCSGCGLCENICPSKAIVIREGRPEWAERKCLRCCACINRCPSEAIQFGRATAKRNRYYNPRV